jgi:hypothetical protein
MNQVFSQPRVLCAREFSGREKAQENRDTETQRYREKNSNDKEAAQIDLGTPERFGMNGRIACERMNHCFFLCDLCVSVSRFSCAFSLPENSLAHDSALVDSAHFQLVGKGDMIPAVFAPMAVGAI